MKWRKADEIKLSRSVQKFNSALTRLKKKMPELQDSGILPSRMSVQKLKEVITDRNAYNRLIKRIDRFFKKGSRDVVRDTQGNAILRWEKSERQYEIQRINRQRQELRKKYNITDKSKAAAVGLEKLEIRKIEKDYNDQNKRHGNGRQGLDNFFNNLFGENKKSLDENFYSVLPSYFKTLRQEIGGYEAEHIISELKRRGVSGADLLYAMGKDDTFDFDFIYGPEEAHEKYEQIMGLMDLYFYQRESEEFENGFVL